MPLKEEVKLCPECGKPIVVEITETTGVEPSVPTMIVRIRLKKQKVEHKCRRK